MRFSSRSDVAPFRAMDVLARATAMRKAGEDVISLAVGQPGAGVPQGVRDAASAHLADGRLAYTDALGRSEAREAISRHYRDHYGLDVPASRIVITTGSSAGFSLAFLALAEAGGRVATTSPGYPAYRNIIRAQSMECVEIDAPEVGAGQVFNLDALLARHSEKPIDILLFASPANPTGATVGEDELRTIIETCQANGIAFVSDEIYHRLRYDGDDVSALSMDDDAIIINSFSKFYCMTGWRIGWMVVPEAMVRRIECLAQSLYISAPDLSQRVVPAVFDHAGELEGVRESYVRNRALMMETLPAIGMPFAAEPNGAFYAWCDVSAHGADSAQFAQTMLDEVKIAAVPGIDFDLTHGHKTMRLSYAGAEDEIATALQRLRDWLG